MSAEKFIAYVGFVDGKLCAERTHDAYGSHNSIHLFTNLKDARKQYEDVRRVVLTVEPITGGRR
jgi:hypothetical protein